MKIAVVGAGISGLICAYELKQAGYEVDIYDDNPLPGGRMGSYEKDGFFVDYAANYFLPDVKWVPHYCKIFDIPYLPIKQQNRYILYKGKHIPFAIRNPKTLINFPPFSLKTWIRFFIVIIPLLFRCKSIYDLSLTPKKLDSPSAAETAIRVSKDFNDYIVDASTCALAYYHSDVLSQNLLLNILKESLRHPLKPTYYIGKMKNLPVALLKELNLIPKRVISVTATDMDKAVITDEGSKSYDRVVIACPTPSEIYSGTERQNTFMKSIHYSSTISISYKIPKGIIDFFSLIYTPYVESKKISIISNESRKDPGKDSSILGIAIHGEYAKELFKKSTGEISALIKEELPKVAPFLKEKIHLLEEFFIQPIKHAFPIFSPAYVTATRTFWSEGQGDRGIYFCGDYMNTPLVEGSIICGRKVALRIQKSFTFST